MSSKIIQSKERDCIGRMYMHVKSAIITVAKPQSTAARQMAIQKIILEASWTSKGKRVLFWRWRVQGTGRDEPGMGNESRTILVFLLFSSYSSRRGVAYGV
jgi:hypothetical protein